MAVAATSTDLRESLIAQRIVRVQPLPLDVCQWITHESPTTPQARVALMGDLVERICATNSRPYPYLAICAVASVLPYYRSLSIEEQSQRLPGTLNALCGLSSLGQLRVVVEEEWKVLTEAAQQQAWLPTYFASEYLTVDCSLWCRELVEGSLALLSEKGSCSENDINEEFDSPEWEKSFRDAEALLLASGKASSSDICNDLSVSHRSALFALVERAKAALNNEQRLGSIGSSATAEPADTSNESQVVASSALADSLKSSAKALPKVAASSTHPAIEEYFSSLDDNELRMSLESALNEARSLEVPVNLVVIRELKTLDVKTNTNSENRSEGSLEIQKSPSREWLEQVCEDLSQSHDDCEFFKMYSIRSGELVYVQGGGDRLKLLPFVRNVLDGSAALLSGEVVSIDGDAAQTPNGLVAGLASVGRPNKSFRSSSLLQASLRCLEAAQRQGAGTIKSIEVF